MTYVDDFIHFTKILQAGIFEEARAFYDSGLSLLEISKRLKRSKSFVRSTLIQGGVSFRPSTHVPENPEVGKRRRPMGAAPYGFIFLRGELVMHPGEIENVLTILDFWKKGQSYNAIAKRLNALAIPSKKGRSWDHSSVSSVVERHRADPELTQWFLANGYSTSFGSCAQVIPSNPSRDFKREK